VVQHTNVLDGIVHNQVVLENRLNRLQTIMTTQCSEVH